MALPSWLLGRAQKESAPGKDPGNARCAFERARAKTRSSISCLRKACAEISNSGVLVISSAKQAVFGITPDWERNRDEPQRALNRYAMCETETTPCFSFLQPRRGEW